MEKRILVKALKLDKLMRIYQAGGRQRLEAFDRFEKVFGNEMANHLLTENDNAED